MAFSFCKLGRQQTGLTVTMIISCLFEDTQNLFMLLFVQNYKYLCSLAGNIDHPNIAYFPCVFGFGIEQEFPVRVYI